ncbi:MAG TPA: hypothetical protein PKM41_03150 [Deltaproteobacteria bacterium]|nr:hypothetical protein [Deltaproteobacteria bacterium]HOI05760.1 hypothetical protein [Deltaproteobacteria bacterium]
MTKGAPYFLKGFLMLHLILISLPLGGCTHLSRPTEIVSVPDAYHDWGRNPPGPSDRAKHVIRGKRPFEWWYFDGHLDNGQSFVGVFFDPSFTAGKPGVAFSLYEKDWTKQTRVMPLESPQMSASTLDVCIECPAGSVTRIDDDTYRVLWDLGGLRADFTLTTTAPGWRPQTGPELGITEDDLDFFWTVHQARNRIKGTLTVDGRTVSVEGTGYADHNWGRRPLNEIARKWIWGRILAGDYTIVYADVDYYRPPINARPLYIARKGEVLVGTGSPWIRQSDFATHPVLKRHYPRLLEIEFNDGSTCASIRIRHKALVEEVDLLTVSGRGAFNQWLIRTFVARPTYFRVVADYEGTITRGGKKDRISGECLYEVMGFQ